MIKISEANIKLNTSAQKLLDDCETLNFKVLATGGDMPDSLIRYIKELEITPKDTGKTEDSNEVVWTKYNQRALVNTNTDYGKDIYEGPTSGQFHNMYHPPYKNKYAMAEWLENEATPIPMDEYVLNSIENEIRSRLR